MPRALSHRLLVAVLIAVAAVIVTAGPLRSQIASQGLGDERSLVAPGPFTHSRSLTPLAPSLPKAGPNGVAIWVHSAQPPAAAVGLLRAAGIPATVMRDFDDAARHPLVLSWPATHLNARGRARVLVYVHHGGIFLAVAPSKAVRAAIGSGHTAFFTRLVQVPELGLESGGHLRDSQIAALRRFWAATPGGFRLGDAPGGARSALVLLHDVRGLPALRASRALVQREGRTGVRATYVLQTRYLPDARGTALVGPALEQLVHAVRSARADAVAGGVAGGPLDQTPRGSGSEAYPTYAAAFASATEVDGETLSGELRVSRHVLDALGAGDVQSFRGVSGATPRGFAAIAEASGFGVDATLSVDAAGGSFPFWQVQADGLERRLLRFPVAFDDVPGEGPAAALAGAWVALRRNRSSGAPTLVELTPDRKGCSAAVERALLADTPPDVWRGTLDRLASFWEQRAGMSLDARPLGAGRGWLVRVRSERRASGQSLVAPFPVARAVGADGHPLAVRDGRRVVLPAFHGMTAVVIVPARAKVNRSGDPSARALSQAATRLPRQLTRLSSSANVCR
ncbi:MAG TPA: hypothetical protein VFD90_16185 [Gaiellales bacterium]|nr:hypothetical protein [Gaiellales bacterium]